MPFSRREGLRWSVECWDIFSVTLNVLSVEYPCHTEEEEG